MDGTKSITDTSDSEKSGRQAFCSGRSVPERGHGPSRNENPGDSRNLAV
jgi:hypothetical protein